MKDHPQRTARLQLIEAMFAGHSWQSAVAQSHLQISRSAAYRLVQRARNAEQAALVFLEGRHGHPSKVTQPVQAWLLEVCTHDPQMPSCRLQAELKMAFGISASIGHLNRVRAQYGVTRQGHKQAAGLDKKTSEVSPHPDVVFRQEASRKSARKQPCSRSRGHTYLAPFVYTKRREWILFNSSGSMNGQALLN